MLAAWNGHRDTVNALAGTYTANAGVADPYGRTALMLAAREGTPSAHSKGEAGDVSPLKYSITRSSTRGASKPSAILKNTINERERIKSMYRQTSQPI